MIILCISLRTEVVLIWDFGMAMMIIHSVNIPMGSCIQTAIQSGWQLHPAAGVIIKKESVVPVIRQNINL